MDGEQQTLSFRSIALDFAEKYTVCYWTSANPGDRHCVELQDGDCATFNGQTTIRSVGG